jgi:hypothetical protein
MKKKCNKKFPGFVSIFAIFFSAIVISVLTALYILLIKQVELMSYDASSFQALYTADSAFECALYKEQTASTTSVFTPTYSSQLGFCANSGDTTWSQSPAITSGRSISTMKMNLTTSLGDFCGVVAVNKETRVTAFFTTAPDPDSMNISGQNRACSDTTSKSIERVIEFYY